MDPLDIDPNFEPQTRARSNTWPLPRPENFVEGEEKQGHMGGGAPGGLDPPKKNSSRRNAWGNMSYADLITQAIQSSPEKRLTLAQIYEWMVQNVAYFKDKGDSNSSAGWKNSIRHNLSLHNRFMRVQNEGTGKSSWWMINPDAKPGKAARRRATSMETQKYEKKRGRVKKKVEALRNGATPSPSSSVSEGQDLFPDSPVHHGFQLSPDFRPRASSNASSCGGRLSPIPAVESDGMGDMPPLSPIPWNPEMPHLAYEHQANNPIDRYSTDHLVKSLSESMKLRNGSEPDAYSHLSDCAVKPNGRSSGGGYTLGYPPHYNNGGQQRPDYRPPSYQQHSPDPLMPKRSSPPQQQVIETVNGRQYTLTRLQNICSQQQQPQPPPLDPYRQVSFLDDAPPPMRIKEERLSPLLPPTPPPAPSYHQHMMQQQQMQHQQQQQGGGVLLYNPFPQDLDFEPLPGGLECDVDQVIRHELSVDGNLDFNFDPANNGHHQTAITSATRSWVH